MQAGQLRHRITIQAPVTASDPFQTVSAGSWTNVLTCWARIESVDPRDVFNSGQQTMKVTHKVTMRYPGSQYAVGAGNQIVYGSRVFSVVGGILNEDERNRQLQLFAWEMNPVQGG
jgi:SPP1 family predicted phage head-tail adaptor